jgi:hypothetical protein
MSQETAFSTWDDEVETGAPVAERNVAPHLAALGEKARDYARNARSENTQRAYDADWRQFSSWLRRQGFDPLPPNPQTVGLYFAACVDGGRGKEPISVVTLERRLSGICWRYRQLAEPLDASDRHISTVLAGIRRGWHEPQSIRGDRGRRKGLGAPHGALFHGKEGASRLGGVRPNHAPRRRRTAAARRRDSRELSESLKNNPRSALCP